MVQSWYDANAERFRDTAAAELCAVGLTARQQARLNELRLALLRARSDARGLRVLEFGCGHGRSALALPGFAESVGIGDSQTRIELGTERLAQAGLGERARLVVGDFESSPGPRDWDGARSGSTRSTQIAVGAPGAGCGIGSQACPRREHSRRSSIQTVLRSQSTATRDVVNQGDLAIVPAPLLTRIAPVARIVVIRSQRRRVPSEASHEPRTVHSEPFDPSETGCATR
jgi:SAM-dependent methyltransferase